MYRQTVLDLKVSRLVLNGNIQTNFQVKGDGHFSPMCVLGLYFRLAWPFVFSPDLGFDD